mmetsp:Transcript_238/g.640  ORF Transcript_238/g.640 Transcript_238/m.640 type:complete len:403 (+) Transcript_238:340-1548(+)
MSFQSIDSAVPMRGQVGGVSFDKRPVKTLKPDYALKPVHRDSRGIREIAFYEALKLASQHGGRKGNNGAAVAAAAAMTGGAIDRKSGAPKSAVGQGTKGVINTYDALAMLVAIFVKDTVVVESEHTVVSSWKAMKREIELLRRLSTFTAQYYGVVGQDTVTEDPTESPTVAPSPSPEPRLISTDAHILLSDVTINFSKPCAIDLKIGQQSYEPDAPPDKREREIKKYPQQKEFGFRIVGMRIYDPSHPESDSYGFYSFDKLFGRSLGTRDDVMAAFRTFFSVPGTVYETLDESSLPCDGFDDSMAFSSGQKIRTRVITDLLSQLIVIKGWFEENTALGFYSSSILMVYEGDMSVRSNRDVTNLKMIDFSHVRRQAGGDSGYLHGVNSVIGMFNELLRDSTGR